MVSPLSLGCVLALLPVIAVLTAASDDAPGLRIRDPGTPDAWIAWDDRAALGFGFSEASVLAEPDAAREFAEWAPPRGMTLVRSRAVPGPDLRTACARFRALGILVQLDVFGGAGAGPGMGGAAGPDAARWRAVLDATGDLGSVFFELDPGARPDGEEWLAARLDEVEEWERRRGRDVLVAAPAPDREDAVAASDPRVEILLVPAADPARHAEVRRRFRKPTAAVATLSPTRNPAITGDPAVRAASLRTLWELFAAGCQLACLPIDGGPAAYRGGPLNDLRPEELPGAEATHHVAPWGRLDGSASRVLEAPAERVSVLVSPRRAYPGEDAHPKSGYVVVGPTAGGPMRLDALWYLSDVSPFAVQARRMRFDTGEADTVEYGFDRDDLVLEIPAWPHGGVVTLRRVFRRPFFHDAGRPDARADLSAESLGESRVRIRWAANHSPAGPDAPLAWIQRFPDGAWIGRTPDREFLDYAPPGPHWYLLSWREGVEGIRGPDVAAVTVPDSPPPAPEAVLLGWDEGEAALWARGAPEPDLTRWEWEIRESPDAPWRAWRQTDRFTARGNVSGEVRVRVVDAAGQTGPFSAAVVVRP